MRGLLFATVAGVITFPAAADPIAVVPVIDARLRYEQVEQASVPREADAVTARVRAGVEAKSGDFALLAESEATLAIDPAYNSGVNGKTAYPIVADPQNVELNRLQLQYRGLAKTVVTVGRQRINLDDQRFVGSVGWRDNEQTFDAARFEWAGMKGVRADVTYAWSDRTIYGVDGGNSYGPARYGRIDGNNVFANLAAATPVGTLTGFAYLVDQNEPLVLALSSQTYGARLVGHRKLGRVVRLAYTLSYARQSDYGRNPNRHAASYYTADGGVDVGAAHVGGGYEVLGADRGTPLTSFQTPLATLHKFNGWADKFLVTPPNGLRDTYGSAGYGWKTAGPFTAVGLTAVYHRFDSDRAALHYGNEVDVLASARHGRTLALVEYADYSADRFATDTRKIWVTLEWAI